nr:hypothetical protein [uncultured Allomuricauda sp.]
MQTYFDTIVQEININRRKSCTLYFLLSISILSAQNIDDKIDSLMSLHPEYPESKKNIQIDLMRDLIDYTLVTNHKGKYKRYYLPLTLKEFKNQGRTYFYRAVNVSPNEKLFYWFYKNGNTWDVNSLIIKDLDNINADYDLSILQFQNQDLFIFKSNEANLIVVDEDVIKRIDYELDDYKGFSSVYINTKINNEKMTWSSLTNQNIQNVDILSLTIQLQNEKNEKRRKALADKIGALAAKSSTKNKALYLTELQVGDVNDDGELDFYWVAISKGQIHSYDVYSFSGKKWRNISNNLNTDLFLKNEEIVDQMEYTK